MEKIWFIKKWLNYIINITTSFFIFIGFLIISDYKYLLVFVGVSIFTVNKIYPLYCKNYIKHSSDYICIKLNQPKIYKIHFKDIEFVHFKHLYFTITKFNGDRFIFNIQMFSKRDISILKNILIK